jgi:hypothetical protein
MPMRTRVVSSMGKTLTLIYNSVNLKL